jgi:hypothetical protein
MGSEVENDAALLLRDTLLLLQQAIGGWLQHSGS